MPTASSLIASRNSGKSDEAALWILLEIDFVLAGEDAVFDSVPELDFYGLWVGSRRNRLAFRKRRNIDSTSGDGVAAGLSPNSGPRPPMISR
jgi:hypothetical protein